MSTEIRVGIVGAAGRGKGFRLACEASEALVVHAVCDIDEEGLARAKNGLGAAEAYMAAAAKAGHGGGDYFEVKDFVASIQGRAACPVGIDEAMDMTLSGLVSQASTARGGVWLDVPDSREW